MREIKIPPDFVKKFREQIRKDQETAESAIARQQAEDERRERKIAALPSCANCGHSAHMHYTTTVKTTGCRHETSGVSTSGIIGEPWRSVCNCVAFKPAKPATERE